MGGLVRSIDLGELRAFCAAVDLGSLGRAARLLRVSQPALSKRMRALENLAGAPLLERTPRGVAPTPAGTRLYVEAKRLLEQAETVESLIAGLSGEEHPVRLGASHTIAEFVLPGPLVEFELQHSRHLSVELVIANSGVVRSLVSEGRAEFGIAAVPVARQGGERDEGPRPGRALREEHLLDDEVVVAVPPEHPWAAARAIAPEDFVRARMVMRDPSANTRRTVEAALAARDLRLAPPLAEVGSTSAATAAALSEGAPALLSRLAVERAGGGLVARRVRGLRFARRFAVVMGAEETLSPAARALRDHLVASVRDGAKA
jgi:DNA-binding transcriptional LysR family regulator